MVRINVAIISQRGKLLWTVLEVRDESGMVIVQTPISNADAERLIEAGVKIIYLDWQ